MIARSFALASAVVATTMAQSTSVTSLFLYGSEGDNIVASVISVAPKATTYLVTCAVGTDSSDCGFGPGETIVEGPSTFGLHIMESGEFTMDVDCKIASETAICTETDAGPEANFPGTITSTVSDLSDSLLPVTITAGLEKLSAGGSASATASETASSGTAEPSASASSGASSTGSSASSTASATGTSTSSSSSSTASGAAPRINGNILAAGGALVGVLGVALAL